MSLARPWLVGVAGSVALALGLFAAAGVTGDPWLADAARAGLDANLLVAAALTLRFSKVSS